MVFNVNAECVPSTTFLEEIAAVLVAAGVGTSSGATASIFATSGHAIPTGDGPYVSIVAGPGAPALHVQNQRSPAGLVRPAAQITVRAKSYGAAWAKAWAAHDALLAVVNQSVTA